LEEGEHTSATEKNVKATEERGKRKERGRSWHPYMRPGGNGKAKMNKWRNKGVIFELERKQEIICYSSEAKRSKL
jgi:hypothetical protein